MAKIPKTTESDRRHVFSSFKERVDSIKIEPSRKLQTRAHDYVVTSHFLAVLEHWKEVNLSGDFSAFLRVVEPLSQTLPQILHHQGTIFETLKSHIDRADVNSLQPLLELMTQFVHDLGPDFMPHYLTYLDMIVRLVESTNPNDAQNMRNSSNILEWSFNCLAFTFKYLSRTLAMDIMPTFNALIPTLLLTKKTYISRFCAEALSFLIRKLDKESLKKFVDFTFESQSKLLEESEFFRVSLVVLFSESMKNTRFTFHSKSLAILSCLVDSALDPIVGNDLFISVVGDVLLDVLRHGSVESCEKFYTLTFKHFANMVESSDMKTCVYTTQLVGIMCFLESGRKITSWIEVFDVVKQLVDRVEDLGFKNEDEEYSLMTCLLHLFVILIRNCELQTLTRHFKMLNSTALRLASGKYYLPFLESANLVSKEKMASFGCAQLIQSYANGCEKSEDLARLALLLTRELEFSPHLIQDIVVPSKCEILTSLKGELEDVNEVNLISIYWRSSLLQYSSGMSNSDISVIMSGLRSIIKGTLSSSALHSEVFGSLVAVVAHPQGDINEPQISECFTLCMEVLVKFRKSRTFLSSFNKLVTNHHRDLLKQIHNNWSELSEALAKNFSQPEIDMRGTTAELLVSLYLSQNLELPDSLRQIRLIDQIPLTVDNANDIKMRIRQLFSSLAETTSFADFERKCLCHFMIGLLSNQFQPCWLAVYEGLPKLLGSGFSSELWNVLYQYLQFDFKSQEESFGVVEPPSSFDYIDRASFKCQPSDDRFTGSFKRICDAVTTNEADTLAALYAKLESLNSLANFKPLLRARVIKAIGSVASLAEKFGSEFITFVIRILDDSSSDKEESVSGRSDWTTKDKMDLLLICSKFKSLRRAPGNERLFQLILDQLTSKQAQVQKDALTVLFSWNNQSINKYRDNLTNLLDDKLFREELLSLVTKDSNSKIEDADASEVVPIVLRILYGRAKGNSNSSSKSGRKFAVASILPNLPTDYIHLFLTIISEQIHYKAFFDKQESLDVTVTAQSLKSMAGYLNMLQEVYNALGYKYGDVLKSTLPPLVYILVSAQAMVENSDLENVEGKQSRNVRQLGFKCLNTLFKVLEGEYNWDSESSLIFDYIVQPRLSHFAQENAQQPSSLMQIMLGWIEWPNTVPFLFKNDFAATRAIMDLLGNPHIKDAVMNEVLDFCISALTKKIQDMEQFFNVLAIIVDRLLDVLPSIIEKSEDRDINSKASSVLLLIIEGGYIDDNDTRKRLIAASSSALSKPPAQVSINDKVSILLSLSSIVDEVDCQPDELEAVIDVCSKAFRVYKDRAVRESLVKVFASLGNKIPDLHRVAQLLASLNAYSERRMAEPDFEVRLEAFREINEVLYLDLNVKQWLPLIYCALFFINDYEELALRSNAALMLMRYVDCFSTKLSHSDAGDFISAFNSIIMPYLRQGLRKDEEQVREEYINVLAHIVRNSKYQPEFNGLKVLTSDEKDLDFFHNVNHIQLSSRQKAIRGLIERRGELSADCVYHYILPITEVYTICKDERFRNLLDDTHESWSFLVRRVKWDQFKQLFRKHLQNLSRAPDIELRDRVNLLTRLSQALIASHSARKDGISSDVMEGLPDQSDIDRYIMKECIPQIMKILRVRNDETVVARTPLAEVAVNCLLCTSENIIEAELPGTLTSTCQVLRSHTQHLRDAVRKVLGKISKILGARYFKFIIKELKTALSRGAQIHVLSFTVHSLMIATSDSFQVGDLDESAQMIADIIMEDIFGAAGQDKDAEDYVSKMREVKSKKSYDTGELLSANITLPYFSCLVNPLKLLLQENLPLKTERKLNELLRRYALGLNHNPNSSSREILILCFELHQQSLVETRRGTKKIITKETEDHFLVKLDAKPTRISADRSQYHNTLQKLSFELLRTALGRHPKLLTVANTDGFIPLLDLSLQSDDEGLLLSIFKVLDLVIKLPFATSRDDFFERSAMKAFTILQNSPTTASEVCQLCLRYLATVVRHKPTLHLSDSALTYLLTRIIPDLEEPDKQGLAFNFLKAVVSRHIMLPEVYDVMEKVATILVVNHSKEIRDMSRSIYFQFLMEYEQGTKRLNDAFKFMVNNLNYPTQFGRQSVMELMHSIILRSSLSLLMDLATSFFVGLSNVIVSDESAKCREMATALITQIMKKLGPQNIKTIERFCQNWIEQKSNLLLQRCGLLIYKIYVSVFGFDHNSTLDKEVLSLVINVLERSKSSNSDEQVEWEDVYVSLTVISAISTSLKEGAFAYDFESMWKLIIETLLYPHTWVRLQSAKLIGHLLTHLDDASFKISPLELQTIAYRTLRQLGAPTVSSELSSQIVRNLITIIKKWEAEATRFINSSPESEADDLATARYERATDFAIARLCTILRQESHRDQNGASKTSAIQLTAMIIQILSEERLMEVAERLFSGLFNFIDPDNNDNFSDETVNLAKECLKILEDRVGLTKYTAIYSSVQLQVNERRYERRSKRAQLAISAPEISARRKIRKHERFREKRRNAKDENGFYKAKKRRL